MALNDLTMAILTHPLQVVLAAVTLTYAFRSMLSALRAREPARRIPAAAIARQAV